MEKLPERVIDFLDRGGMIARCNFQQCNKTARHRVILLVRTSTPGHTDHVARGHTSLRVCDACRNKIAIADVVTDRNWSIMREAFTRQGLPNAHRDSLRLDFEELEATH